MVSSLIIIKSNLTQHFLSAVTIILSAIKSTEVTVIKTVKTPPSCVKLVFGAMCVLVGVAPEKLTDAQAKKNVTISLTNCSLPPFSSFSAAKTSTGLSNLIPLSKIGF